MKLRFKELFALLLVCCVSFVAIAGCSSDNDSNSAEADTIIVSASIFPIADLIRQIADDKVQVNLILEPGDSPHTYNPTIKEQEKINESSLIFIIGHDLDNWAAQGIANKQKIISLDKNLNLMEYEEDEHHDEDKHHDEDGHDDHEGHDHEGVDPHYWLDPRNAQLMVQTIASELSRIDPQNKNLYQKNAQEISRELEKLYDEMLSLLQPVQTKPFITLHDAWGYFGNAFGLRIVGSFEPSASEQPTPRYLQELQELISDLQVTAIFSEPQLAVSSLSSFVSDNKLAMGVIDPIGGTEDRDSYQALIRFNCLAILQTLSNVEEDCPC